MTSVKSDSEAEMDDLSDTSLECERREDRSKANSMVQLMSHIQVELSPPANPTCRPKMLRCSKKDRPRDVVIECDTKSWFWESLTNDSRKGGDYEDDMLAFLFPP